MLQQAIDEIVLLIKSNTSQDEIKDRARRLFRGLSWDDKKSVPLAKTQIGYSYYSDDERELANSSSMDDLTMSETANLLGLAHDAINAKKRSLTSLMRERDELREKVGTLIAQKRKDAEKRIVELNELIDNFPERRYPWTAGDEADWRIMTDQAQ